MSTITYAIADTSPLLSYSPCQSCLPTLGWQSAYAPEGNGYDQTFHQTSAESATVSFNITASTITFLTSPPNGVQCAATYSINGSTATSACTSSSSSTSKLGTNNDTTTFTVSNLPAGIHQVVYTPGYSSNNEGASGFEFIGITGEFNIDLSDAINVTADSTLSSAFTYLPSSSAWTQISSSGANGTDANLTAEADLTDMSTFYQQTVSVSTQVGASASLTFSVYLFGMSGPNGGMANVLMDGSLVASVNLYNPWPAYSSLIYMGGSLDQNTAHNLTLTNLDGSQLVLDYAILTRSSTSNNSTAHLAIIIATVAGITASLLALGTCMFLLVVKKRRMRARGGGSRSGSSKNRNGGGGYRANRDGGTYSFENGVAFDDKGVRTGRWGPSGSGASYSSEDSWRRLNDGSESIRSFGNPNSSNLGLDSPPPDYIPYRGPVELAPPQATVTVGNENEHSSPEPSHSTSSSAISSPLPTSSSAGDRRPSPLPLRNNHPTLPLGSPTSFSTEIDGDSQLSPVSLSTPYFATTQVAVRAQNARRSVARLFNTASSTLLSSSRAGTVGGSGTGKLTTNETTTVRGTMMTRGSLTFAPSYTSAGDLVPSAHLQILGIGGNNGGFGERCGQMGGRESRRGGVSVPGSVQAVSTSSSPITPLRRGVSIKSVKTMRSFFSGLFVSSETPPSLPQHDGHGGTLSSAARPDSDIFPSFSISRAPSRRNPNTTPDHNVFSDSPNEGGYGGRARYESEYPSGLDNLPEVGRGEMMSGTNMESKTVYGDGGGSERRAREKKGKSKGDRVGADIVNDGTGHFFIELNPNSPVTVLSRPESEMTNYKPLGFEP